VTGFTAVYSDPGRSDWIFELKPPVVIIDRDPVALL
jgi:hypothetical protein